MSILWPKHWSSKIKKLSEGNERIIAIELLSSIKLCIVNVYLPTNNSATESHHEYAECLDILHNIVSKYRQSHKFIIAGDFNGTLGHIINMINF